MKKIEDSLQKLKDVIKHHKPLIVNYGKGYFCNEDIKDYSVWDEAIGKYRDNTGVWATEMLLEIAKGEVPNTTIEFLEDF